jgi:ParB family transcriptional regulator, chromosome partitioning protein
VILPVHGEGAVVTEVQGRGATGRGSLSPADLDDLISSIGTVGMLQPVLLEELPDGRHRLSPVGRNRPPAVGSKPAT